MKTSDDHIFWITLSFFATFTVGPVVAGFLLIACFSCVCRIES